jgi:bifunctional non-homologous end joining protein LigD
LRRLLYAGKARTGYIESVARELREKLDPLITKKSPLSVPVNKSKATWVEPVLLAEIEYSGITDDGLLREAVFKGLRDDLQFRGTKPKRQRLILRLASVDQPMPAIGRRAHQRQRCDP